MAKGSSPTPRPDDPVAPKGTHDDAFTTRVLIFVAWAQRNPSKLLGSIAAVVLLVVGPLWFFGQRAGTFEEAALQLEQVQQVAAISPPEEAVAELERYLARYGNTPYGIEARLVLGELHLEEGRPEEAIRALREVAPSTRDPLRVQATFLLAAAYEQAERWSEAADAYRELARRAEMTFQRREATDGLARVKLAEGDTAAAIEAIRALIAEFEEEDPVRGYFEMRLHELGGG
jgi:predicted negative regulator of RcsB-dependent stress response